MNETKRHHRVAPTKRQVEPPPLPRPSRGVVRFHRLPGRSESGAPDLGRDPGTLLAGVIAGIFILTVVEPWTMRKPIADALGVR
jgi:hypothetical protein